MTPLGWLIIVIASFIGVAVGYFVFKYFPNLFTKNKKMEEVIQNPQLLVEKLKSHGKIYDGGKELDIKVGIDKETGQEVVVVEEKEVEKAKKIQKKITEDKTKIKKKGKKRKKGERKK